MAEGINFRYELPTDILLFSILALVLIALAAIFLFRPYDYGESVKRFKGIAGPKVQDPSADTQWRSVKIRPGLNSCKLVRSLEDQVFLSKEAPALPLEYCTEANCTCHYLFQDDRRSGVDRRVKLTRVGEFLSGIERRRSPGRRMADLTV